MTINLISKNYSTKKVVLVKIKNFKMDKLHFIDYKLHYVDFGVCNLLDHGQVAQLVEQGTENPCVGGSIPSLATICISIPNI